MDIFLPQTITLLSKYTFFHFNVQKYFIATTSIGFTIYNVGRVTFTYDVGVTQYGSPDFDSWTWSRWSSIATRLVVDGRPFTHTGTQSDAAVRNNENLKGKIFLNVKSF